MSIKTYICIGLMASGISWATIQHSRVLDFCRWYWHYSPNKYRILEQLLLLFDEYGIPFGQLAVFLWGISVVGMLYIINPNSLEMTPLLILISLMSVNMVIFQSLSWILLPLFCKYKDNKYSFLLLPFLVIIKEFIGLIALIVLFLWGNKVKAIIGGTLSMIAYGVIYVIVGHSETVEGGVPLFTPLFTIDVLMGSYGITAFFYFLIIIFSFHLLSITKKELMIIILFSIPVFLFGLFWEPQLWLPATIVILFHRRWNISKLKTEDLNST